METEHSPIHTKLRQTWRRAQMREHLRGGSCLVIGACTFFLAGFLADWTFEMPMAGRLLLLALSLGVIVGVLFAAWWKRLRRFEQRTTAALVERHHPELKSLLSSFVELKGDEADSILGSAELKQVVQEQAADATDSIRFSEVIRFESVFGLLKGAVFSLIIFTAAWIAWPEHLRIYSMRMAGADVSYPTQTRILSVTGNSKIKQGESLTLSAKAGGRVPHTGSLRIRLNGANWQTLKLERTGEDEFAHDFEHLTSSFDYVVAIGDAETEMHSVRVVPPPGIRSAKVVIRPPAYTQVKELEVEKFNFEVPEGSEVEWRILFEDALSSAEIFVGSDKPENLELTGDGKEVRFRTRIGQSTGYRFRWYRSDSGFVFDAPRHQIYARPDTPPEVSIMRPLDDIKATVNKKLFLEFQGKDDYGLGAAWLVYSINDGEELKIPLGKLPKLDKDDPLPRPRFGLWPLQWKINHDLPQIKAGDVISYAIEVADIRIEEDAGIIRRSQPRKISIVSKSEYQNYIFTKLMRVRESLASSQLEARKGRQAIEALLRSLKR
jgi:hypothetical protein